MWYGSTSLQFSVVHADILGTPERRAVLTAKLFLFFVFQIPKHFLGKVLGRSGGQLRELSFTGHTKWAGDDVWKRRSSVLVGCACIWQMCVKSIVVCQCLFIPVPGSVIWFLLAARSILWLFRCCCWWSSDLEEKLLRSALKPWVHLWIKHHRVLWAHPPSAIELWVPHCLVVCRVEWCWRLVLHCNPVAADPSPLHGKGWNSGRKSGLWECPPRTGSWSMSEASAASVCGADFFNCVGRFWRTLRKRQVKGWRSKGQRTNGSSEIAWHATWVCRVHPSLLAKVPQLEQCDQACCCCGSPYPGSSKAIFPLCVLGKRQVKAVGVLPLTSPGLGLERREHNLQHYTSL